MRIIVALLGGSFLITWFITAVRKFDVIGPSGVMFVGFIMVAGIGYLLGVFKPIT